MKPALVGERRWYWAIAVSATVAVIALVDWHWKQFGLGSNWYVFANAMAFLEVVTQLGVAHANVNFDAAELVHQNVCVIVPVYNEDPGVFRQLLDALDAQTRRPDFVYVIDDGSPSDDCADVFDKWNAATTIAAKFHKQVNAGKREAQGVAFRDTPDADIYVTVDSDTVLDPKAIEHGIKPLIAEPRVQSVAGLLLGLNYRRNLLTRLVDLSFVTSFMSGRASWSVMHSVSVNCGGLAFYRATTVRRHLHEYLNQTVFGNKVSSGDDRVLTNLALLDGWSVFQENSVAYTLHPANIRHLTKQRVRWWRSFFWGGEWLTRRISPKRLVFWLIVAQFHDFILFTFMIAVFLPYIAFVSPVLHHVIPVALLLYLAALGYIRNIRYLSIKRPDQTLLHQVVIWGLSPLAVLLNFWLCTVLQYWGLATVRHTGWSTRQKIEVRADAG